MIKRQLVQSAQARIRKAEALITAAMTDNGIPLPAVIIHADMQCTLASTAAVFLCGKLRPRLETRITVPYGPKVEAAIAAAGKVVRQGQKLQ
jgi:hypothetical protein